MNNAIKPNFFSNFPILSKEDELAKKGITDEERYLYGMSQTAGWVHFKKTSDQLIEQLDQFVDQAVVDGKSTEEIGQNTIVVSLAKGIVRRLMNLVDDAKEACETAKPTGGA